MGEHIINGLINTVIGMGTVFIVLIFISFVISLFVYIPKLEARLTGKKEAPQVEKPQAPPVVEEVEQEKELVDDTELVAVITAAIMASMGDEAPSDGLVVRSIRKVNKSKWQTV